MKKYMSIIVAALIVIAAALGTFIYSLLKSDPEDMGYLIEEVDGTYYVTPKNVKTPDGPPVLTQPVTPPPAE